jgi:hypothetical protein
VQALVERTPGACLIGITNVTMSGAATRVDSYDPSTFVIAGNANVGSNADIDLSGGASINGSATAGGIVGAPTFVTGTSTNGAPAQSYPTVGGCSPYSSGAGMSGSYTYNSGTGNMTVSGGNHLTLTAGSYCFNDFTLSGGSTLSLSSGPVVLYLTGKGNFSGGSISNTSHVASNLQLFSSASNVSTQQVTISGGTDTYMTVYAPSVPIVISGGSGFFGKAVGYSVNLSGGTQFNCDQGLLGGALQLLSWRDMRSQ